MSALNIGFLDRMCYNISTTYVAANKPVATQKNLSYHYQSPARLPLHRWYSVTGSLVGFCFWGVCNGLHLLSGRPKGAEAGVCW